MLVYKRVGMNLCVSEIYATCNFFSQPNIPYIEGEFDKVSGEGLMMLKVLYIRVPFYAVKVVCINATA